MEKLEYKGYFGSIEYSPADNYFYGNVQGIPKNLAITYEGDTATDLVQDFRDGIDSYLDYCERKNIEPKKSYNGVLNIRIPAQVHCEMAMIAKDKGTTINAFIRESIEKNLRQPVRRHRVNA
ncbi:MAG: type II toxin-antitoxin system HicB family antitoxin [Paludibacter sp.]|jgi:predicted HicB family RNase H-like nuclease|nr:type II toxin-antitoxin system HicB family antitoxin [Paludibacter sp.]